MIHLKITKEYIGEPSKLLILSAPEVMEYYPKTKYSAYTPTDGK